MLLPIVIEMIELSFVRKAYFGKKVIAEIAIAILSPTLIQMLSSRDHANTMHNP
jgi:hypothetical protein